jgi:hypothetical protein
MFGKMKIKVLFLLLVMPFLFSAPVKANGLAESYCQAYLPMIEQAIYFRNSGIPISVATDMVDSAWDANKELWNWLRDIVDLTYSDPNLVAGAYQDGRLYSDCVQQVRGY